MASRPEGTDLAEADLGKADLREANLREADLNGVNLRERRALAMIKEFLGAVGHDFTSRNGSIKMALGLATKARPEELARLYRQVKAENKRFRADEGMRFHSRRWMGISLLTDCVCP
jgi:hypothetical protein